ncbi:MAG: hypothetical protein WD749_13945, partial [Phycisphaerales bacterium]
RGAGPAAAVRARAAGGVALYTLGVAGDPFRVPYLEYREQYQVLPIFQWQAVREEPPGLNRMMREYAQWELAAGRHHSRPGPRVREVYRTLVFMVGPVLAPAMLLLLPWTARQRWMLFALGAFALFLAGSMLSTFFQTHYLSPGAGLAVILATGALRRIGAAPLRPRRLWRALALALVGATLGAAALAWAGEARAPERMMEHWAKVRDEVRTTLEREGGRHIVFVRYGAGHTCHVELVYNGADVDAAPVVWARLLDPEEARRVLAHYPGRRAWVLDSQSERQEPNFGELPPGALAPAPPAVGH